MAQPGSLQQIIKHRQQLEFVGREEQLGFFRRNLRYKLTDERRRFVINVYGQGGVGKTWLLRRLRAIAEEASAITAYADENEEDLPELMSCVADQFEKQGHSMETFAKRYKVYRQRRQEIEADPDAPQGFPALLGSTLAKGGLTLAHLSPVGGVVADLVDKEAAATLVGDFATYLARKIGNKDEVHLMLKPVEVLTPLFLADLREVAEKYLLALFFDTYERTGDFLDPWLRDLLGGRHGDVPPNVVLVIAGQCGLDRSSWASYEGLLTRLPLEPFTEEEARDYLGRKGITDERVVHVILRLSERLPLLVATLAAESPDDPEKVGELGGEAVEQFLNWAGASQRRQVALNAALPRLLNRDVLAVLMGEEEADALFAWLKDVPFVKRKGDGWAYHDVVRMQMVHYKRQEAPRMWADLHGRLAEYYEGLRNGMGLEEEVGHKDETWRGYALEALYHRLCQSPRKQLTAALNGFLEAWQAQRALARRWAKVVGDAGEDTDTRSLKQWGQRLVEGLSAYDQGSYGPAAEMFTALLGYRGIEERWRSTILEQRGLTYLLIARHIEALADFDQAIELRPNNPWAMAHRGETYRQMGRYKEALTCFNSATSLDDKYTWAIILRGETRRQMGQYEEALKDFDQAIELEPESAWIRVLRAETYRQMGQYEEALACLKRATELDPEYAWAIVLRGETYQQLGRNEEALKDFDRAVKLKKKALTDLGQTAKLRRDCAWALIQRGRAHLQAGRYEAALADFDQAVKLNEDDAEALAHRGETYRLTGRYEEALPDFDQAIELKDDYTWAFVLRGETHRQMGRHEEALKDFGRAIELEPGNVWILVLRSQAYRQMGHFEEALADLGQAIDLRHDYAWAFSQRGKMYQQMGEYEKALDDFNQAIELQPDDAQGLCNRALTHRILGREDKSEVDLSIAVQLARMACKAEPQDWRSTLSLAFCHLVAGDVDEAESTYREALSGGALPYHIRESIGELEDASDLFHKWACTMRDRLQDLLEEADV